MGLFDKLRGHKHRHLIGNSAPVTTVNTPVNGNLSGSCSTIEPSPAASTRSSFKGTKSMNKYHAKSQLSSAHPSPEQLHSPPKDHSPVQTPSASTKAKNFDIHLSDSAMKMTSPTTTTTMRPKRFDIPDNDERQKLPSSLISTSTGKSTELFGPTPPRFNIAQKLQDKFNQRSMEEIPSSFDSNISSFSNNSEAFDEEDSRAKDRQIPKEVSLLNLLDKIAELVEFAYASGVHKEDVWVVVDSIYEKDRTEARARSIYDLQDEKAQTLSKQLYEKGKDYALLKQHEKAIECYENALKYSGPAPHYYNKIALSYAYLGNTNMANTYCKKSLQLNPDYHEVYKTYGVICRYQYAKHKAQGDLLSAEVYNREYNKYMQQYREFIHNDPKKEAKRLLDQSLMCVVRGDLGKANEYLQDGKEKFRKHYDSIKKNTHNQISTEECKEYQAKVTLIDEVTLCIQEPKSQFKFGHNPPHATAKLSPDTLSVIQGMLEILTLSPGQEQLNDCISQITQINRNIKQLQEECVTRPEVSVAIKNNPAQLLADSQMEIINNNFLLKKYYDALVATITTAVESARVIVDAKVEIGKTTITMAVAKQLLSWIPVCGSAVSGITSAIGESIQELNITNDAKRLYPIASDLVNLHNIVCAAAREITFSKKDQILSCKDEQKEENFFTKIFNQLDQAMQSAVSEIYVKLYNTPAGLLGHEDGFTIVTRWINKQKALEKIPELQRQPMSDSDIIAFMKAASMPDYQEANVVSSALAGALTNPYSQCSDL